MLRWLLWIIGGLVVLLVVALFAVPPLTGGLVAERIVDAIERETGRQATVGEVSWRLLPSPSAHISGLSIANDPDGVADDLVTLATAEADIALLPLITGKVVVDNLIVRDLVVALEEAEDGSVNWAFGDGAAPSDQPAVGDSDRGREAGGRGLGAVIESISVSGVAVTYRRLPEDQPAVAVLDGGLTGSLTEDGAIDLIGSAMVNGQPVDLTVHADQVADLMAGQGSLAVNFESPVATARIDGSQSGGGFAGTVDVQVPSLTAVADFLAIPADQRPPFESLSLVADLAGDSEQLQIDNIALAIDDATVTGSATFAPGPPRRVTAQLQAAGFDLAVLPTADAVERIGGLVDAEIDIIAEGDDGAAMQQTLDGTINVTVRDGLVHVRRPDGSRAELEQLSASFSMAGRQSGTDLAINGMLNGRAVSVEGSVGSVEAATAGAVPARFTVSADRATFTFDGQADAVGQAVSGTVDVDIPSLSGLMSWLDMAASDLPVERITASGTIDAAGQTVTVSDFSFALDDLTGTASLTAAGEPMPTLNGSVVLGRIDVDAFSGSGTSAGGGGSAGGSAGGSGSGQAGGAGNAGAARFDMLNDVAVDLTVTAEALAYSGVVTGPTTIDLDIANGALALVVADTPVNDGSIGASFAANAADRSIGVNLSVAGVAARPFLTSFADIDWLSGTATIDAALTGSGETRSAILSSLAGNGSFLFRDGSVDGVNIGGVLRDPVGALSNPGMLETQSTDFAELSATMTVANGLATTSDLVMLAPIFRMTGQGSASLPNSMVDFLFVPTLVATLEGQGGQVQEGLAIPIRVVGPFDDPNYQLQINPDMIQGLIENPEGTLDALRGLSGEGGSLPSLDQLLQGSDGDGTSTQDLLEGLGRGLLGN